MTTVIPAPWHPSDELQIKSCLQNSGTIAFPTETVYGLGGNAFSESLVERIFQIKQRPSHKPLSLLIDPGWLPQLTVSLTAKIEKLMNQFWPGPLTLILAAHPQLPYFLRGPKHTVAVRFSSASIVQQLISIGQCPIIGTSANLSEQPETRQPSEVLSQLGDSLDLLIDGGEISGTRPSTIVDTSMSPYQIVRSGSISSVDLQPFL
ncbi:MAG: threonylcarbamoyl-AMP synthase [SAR324 cluster bacterium]|nr:threonylcarbamoyl-AMP synthase [SAR324 cluster bacterium]